MPSLNELRTKREEAGKAILALRDKITSEGRDFNAEERGNWDKCNKDFDDLGRQVEAVERGDAVAKALEARKEVKPGAEDVLPGETRSKKGRKGEAAQAEEVRALALQAWFFRQSGKPLSAEHVRACKLTGMRPGAKNLDIRLGQVGRQNRAQSTTTTAGGYTIPQGFVNNLEVALKEWNAVRQSGAEIIRTETGNPLPWPTVNDTTNVGTLLAENTTVGAAVDLTFGQTTFNAYKFSSGLVLVSSELDQDNAVGLGDRMGGLLGERLGRGQEGYFTTGTGSSQPGGVVTGSTLGKTAAGATAILADELIDLYHSVDPAYRRDPSFGFMMHDGVLQAIRKLKDGSGRYLWIPNFDTSIVTASPGVLLGAPVTVNQSMQATVATGTKTVLVGAFSKMKIRDAGVVRVRRLVERYADIDQIGFVAFMRSDSKVLNAGTNPIKYLIQA
jgi:HK97 family phage major capsid protein